MRQLDREDRGVSTIEFALIVPVLVLLIVAFLDLARALNARIVLGGASQEGAHYAILNPTATIPAGESVPPAIVSAAEARTEPLNRSAMCVSAEYYDTVAATFRPWPSAGIPASSPSTTGVLVRVSVSYPWSAVSGVAGNFLQNTDSSDCTSQNRLRSTSLMETRR